jgi:ATP-binding cassette subfamily B protein
MGRLAIAFARRYAARYGMSYLIGLLFLVATNWLTLEIPRLQKEIFDELAGLRRPDQVHRAALLIAAAAALVIVVRTLSRVLFFNPGRTIEFRMRNDMLTRLLGMSPRFYQRANLGDLMARATDDATYVRSLAGFSLIMTLNMILAAGLSVWRMVQTDAWLTLWCVLPMVASLIALRHGVFRTFEMLHEGQKALGALSDTVLETYKGIQTVQGATAEDAFLRRFDQSNERYTRMHLQVLVVRTFLLPVVAVTGNLCIFLLLFIGGRHVVEGTMTLGDIAAYASYVGVLVGALSSAGWVVGVLQRGYVSLRRVWDVLSLTPDLQRGSQPLPPATGGLHVHVQRLRHVHEDAVQADGTERAALRDLSFDLPAGHVLGIHGPVGSGKSTLVTVLARLTNVPRGAVFLDGVDLCDVAADDLRKAVAVVPQEAFLFSRSIRDNVAFQDRAEDVDEARVWQAVRRARLEDEILRFPEGLDTVVGERGMTLSGGQRQRVQLARAFYRGFRLLVLDDVLSAVDHGTESALLDVLREEIRARGTTAIIVSHRLSALALADEVIVLDEGQVVERGTPAELAAAGGLYARVWQAQCEHPDDEQASELPEIVAV